MVRPGDNPKLIDPREKSFGILRPDLREAERPFDTEYSGWYKKSPIAQRRGF